MSGIRSVALFSLLGRKSESILFNGDEKCDSIFTLQDAEATWLGGTNIVGQHAPVREVGDWFDWYVPLDHELAPHHLRSKETSHLQCGTIRSSFLILRRRQNTLILRRAGAYRALFSSSLPSRFLLLILAAAPSTGGTCQRKSSYVPDPRPAPVVRTS